MGKQQHESPATKVNTLLTKSDASQILDDAQQWAKSNIINR